MLEFNVLNAADIDLTLAVSWCILARSKSHRILLFSTLLHGLRKISNVSKTFNQTKGPADMNEKTLNITGEFTNSFTYCLDDVSSNIVD